MGFRDYSPGLNRFLTRDMYNGALADLQLGTDPWNTNRYAFAGGNPITGIELDGHINALEGPSGGNPTLVPTTPLDHEGQVGTTQQDNTSGSTEVAVDRSVSTTQTAAPHPDRIFEMAGCNGGPGCVMPEGSVGKYGPYGWKPGEELAGEVILLAVPLPGPNKLLALSRLAKIGRQTERATEAAGKIEQAAKGGDEAFHYTSSKWIDSITTNGLNKGAYATPNGSLSPLQASLELALPPNRALPDAALRIDLAGLRKAGYDIPTPSRVSSTVSSGGRTYSMPGGGYEMQFPYAIPPEFIKVVPR